MNNYILAGVSAVGGAAVGSFVTWFFCTKKNKKKLAEKQKIVDEIVEQNRKKSPEKEENEEKTEEKEEEPEDDHAPHKEESSLDISALTTAKQFTDYYGISGGNEVKEDPEPMANEEARIQILPDIPSDYEGDPTYLDLYQNGKLLLYLGDEPPLEPDESERLIGYRRPLDLMKLRKAEIYIYNRELDQYFVVCVKYQDYED